MVYHNLLDFGDISAYQEVVNGVVSRYLDMQGVVLSDFPPVGNGGVFVRQEIPSWYIPVADVATVNQPVSQFVSKLTFMERFTDAELVAIYTAAKQVVQIEVWLEKLKLTTGDIDLADPRTIGGVHALEAAGLIASGRAAEILHA